MPSDLIRNILSRRLRYRDGKETVTSQAAGHVSEKATTCALQDPPPPYSCEGLAMNNDKELPSKVSSIQPATAQVSTQSSSKLSSNDSIRFCPHATSSFERMQRIVRLPNFRESYQGLDALAPGPDHRSPFTSEFRLCKPDSGSDLSIKGWGKYLYDKYGTAASRKDKEASGTGEGLVLQFHWMIHFLSVPREQRESRADIHRLLSQTRVEVCTHLMLSDPMIIAAVYKLLHPGDDDVDPIDTWEADCNNSHTTVVACGECATVAEVHGFGTFVQVDTKRCLGRGEDSTDPGWLAQCGV